MNGPYSHLERITQHYSQSSFVQEGGGTPDIPVCRRVVRAVLTALADDMTYTVLSHATPHIIRQIATASEPVGETAEIIRREVERAGYMSPDFRDIAEHAATEIMKAGLLK